MRERPRSAAALRAPAAVSKTPQAPCVAVAALSARMLAQSAARAGLRVIALDVFGDRDTRSVAERWIDIGGAPLTIDRARLEAALALAARTPGLIGWIGGSGIEPFASALCDAPGLPRYIGNRADALAAVRDPRRFFALLDALAIAHPRVSFARPDAPQGWLVKQADGCGGTHIEPAASERGAHPDSPHAYFQREMPGRPLSALFIAARGTARVLGFAEQLVCTIGDLRFVHAGSIGPVDVPPHVQSRVRAALDALCAETALAGLHSCDFLLDGDDFAVLEINARPSSTMALYETAAPNAWPRGLVVWHIAACLDGRLPRDVARFAWRAGQRIVFAPRAFEVAEAFSDACLGDPHCRDVPMPGTRIEAQQPVCTLLVRAASVAAVQRALDAQQRRVLQRIATCHELDHA
jgi:predicted ATP-grasp superfamily ATP-dependent carboligase